MHFEGSGRKGGKMRRVVGQMYIDRWGSWAQYPSSAGIGFILFHGNTDVVY